MKISAYYTGIEFTPTSGEYTTPHFTAPRTPFESAKIGFEGNNHKVTLYVVTEEKIYPLSFNEVSHLNLGSADLEVQIQNILLEKLKQEKQ